MSFEEFQDGGHLGYRNRTILAILNLNVATMQMWFKDFQDGRPGSHLGYANGMILAILNLYVTPILPIKFWLNSTYSLGDVV